METRRTDNLASIYAHKIMALMHGNLKDSKIPTDLHAKLRALLMSFATEIVPLRKQDTKDLTHMATQLLQGILAADIQFKREDVPLMYERMARMALEASDALLDQLEIRSEIHAESYAKVSTTSTLDLDL